MQIYFNRKISMMLEVNTAMAKPATKALALPMAKPATRHYGQEEEGRGSRRDRYRENPQVNEDKGLKNQPWSASVQRPWFEKCQQQCHTAE